MKYHEHYRKYRASYPAIFNPIFSKKNRYQFIIIVIASILIEPLLMYKHHKSVSFSLSYYLHVAEYFSLFFIPFILVLFWLNWRESIKRSRGYWWIGKFEVIEKRSSFTFYYLLISPGENNELKVSQHIFEQIHVGDFIQVRRDALGNLEGIRRITSFSTRLAKLRTKRFT